MGQNLPTPLLFSLKLLFPMSQCRIQQKRTLWWSMRRLPNFSKILRPNSSLKSSPIKPLSHRTPILLCSLPPRSPMLGFNKLLIIFGPKSLRMGSRAQQARRCGRPIYLEIIFPKSPPRRPHHLNPRMRSPTSYPLISQMLPMRMSNICNAPSLSVNFVPLRSSRIRLCRICRSAPRLFRRSPIPSSHSRCPRRQLFMDIPTGNRPHYRTRLDIPNRAQFHRYKSRISGDLLRRARDFEQHRERLQ